ncbi:MAG: hypothetical protein WC799_24475 [Desulfobacteraceae bacterium]
MKELYYNKIAGQPVIVENRVTLIVKRVELGDSMKVTRNRRLYMKLLYIFTTFFLLLMAFGCGNDPAASSNPYDPFSVYDGKKTPADMTSHNVYQIVFELYINATQFGDIHDVPFDENGDQPRKKSGFCEDTADGITELSAVNTKGTEYTDGNGGSLVSDIDIDRQSGKAEGSVSWDNYRLSSSFGLLNYEAVNECVAKGSALVSGAVDLQRGVFTQVTLSFHKLKLIFNNSGEAVVTGKIAWDFDDGDITENMTMDVTINDENDKTLGMFKNFKITAVKGETGISLVLSGRYYSADLGFVDVLTSPEVLFVEYDSFWPVYGVIVVDNTAGEAAYYDFDYYGGGVSIIE